MSYNGMTIEEIADASTEHSRFDEEHRAICEDCRADYVDFIQEQAAEARLDAMAEGASDED